MSKYSQADEEYILDDIVRKIGVTNKFFVEIGCHANGEISNTFFLKELGWVGHWFDMVAAPGIIQKFFTAENINHIFTEYFIPPVFDVLSIDIDGNDYWIWKALTFEPRIVIIEFNPKRKKGVQRYDPDYEWQYQETFGSSKEEMVKLGEEKGYYLHGETIYNLIFVKK